MPGIVVVVVVVYVKRVPATKVTCSKRKSERNITTTGSSSSWANPVHFLLGSLDSFFLNAGIQISNENKNTFSQVVRGG